VNRLQNTAANIASGCIVIPVVLLVGAVVIGLAASHLTDIAIGVGGIVAITAACMWWANRTITPEERQRATEALQLRDEERAVRAGQAPAEPFLRKQAERRAEVESGYRQQAERALREEYPDLYALKALNEETERREHGGLWLPCDKP
jgi:hypothetical protein